MVPNSISGLSMVLGVLSIYLSMDGEFSRAAIFIILAVLADSCDGRAARLLGVSGEFGKEMDSICDVCSFGMAPAVLIYTYGLTDLGLWGQIISSLFTFGAGLRLARFNVNTSVVSGYFEGMPARWCLRPCDLCAFWLSIWADGDSHPDAVSGKIDVQ